jgi:hypothetical protein
MDVWGIWRLNFRYMNNLAHYVTYEDRSSHILYQIRSHKKLSEEEQIRAITKKSLQTVVGQRHVYPNAPDFQIIRVDAADGWEDAA